MWSRSRSLPIDLPVVRAPSTPRARALSRALVAFASLAGLSLIAIALVAPRALNAGMPVALLFYPVLWAAAIAAYRRY